MVKVNKQKGKEILMHAVKEEYCVLEFSRMDDGSMNIVDITDHHKQLEEMAGVDNNA